MELCLLDPSRFVVHHSISSSCGTRRSMGSSRDVAGVRVWCCPSVPWCPAVSWLLERAPVRSCPCSRVVPCRPESSSKPVHGL